MTRMTRPDCAVMCNLINTHTHTHEHKIHTSIAVENARSPAHHLFVCLSCIFQERGRLLEEPARYTSWRLTVYEASCLWADASKEC